MDYEVKHLSERHKLLISQTWTVVGSFDRSYDLAICIYEKFFQLQPDAVELFSAIDPENIDLRRNQPFRNMALRLVQTISAMVRNLNHLDSMTKTLSKIGHAHANHSSSEMPIKNDHWSAMKEAIVYSVCEDISKMALDSYAKSDAREAWIILISYVVDEIKLSFDQSDKS